MIIAGVDIGNSTTEVCIGEMMPSAPIRFLGASQVPTTGIKGDIQNIKGIKEALHIALTNTSLSFEQLDCIRLNEAAPVIGHTAMETISETIITESTMIGHNPDTPAGEGLAIGETLRINDMAQGMPDRSYILLIPKDFDYETVADRINASTLTIVGCIVQKDEAVLIYNRLKHKIPIVDEVEGLSQIPLQAIAAIEVAYIGETLHQLSNPYGLAKVFDLSPEDTRRVIPIAKSLIGKKSGIVIKSQDGQVKERLLNAGKLKLIAMDGEVEDISLDVGADKIMEVVTRLTPIMRIQGEENTQVGDMLGNTPFDVKDVLAVDTFVPMKVKGALAGEVAMEKAVAIAAMVNTHQLPMRALANRLQELTGIKVEVAGIEAVMATLGALTTKGTRLPLAILDLGGGSTDAALIDTTGYIVSTHLAGAGAFVTLLIDKELGLQNTTLAELIKCYPLATVKSLHHILMENGDVKFFEQPLEPRLFAQVVIMKDKELIPIPLTRQQGHSMEKIRRTRRRVKKKVFVLNALRALKEVAPENNIRNIPNVVMVGGSALDAEVPELISEALADFNIVAGRGDIRGVMGPRNAVATGLVMSQILAGDTYE